MGKAQANATAGEPEGVSPRTMRDEIKSPGADALRLAKSQSLAEFQDYEPSTSLADPDDGRWMSCRGITG